MLRDRAVVVTGSRSIATLEIQQIVLRLLVLSVAGLRLPTMRCSNERTPADGSAGSDCPFLDVGLTYLKAILSLPR
jgi:hypothetical protein